MPFTVSHVAAVRPLRGRTPIGLPLAALAAGSMSPDLPYFLPLLDWTALTPSPHSLLGILSWDLLFGLALWALWRTGARSIHHLAPEFIRRRWRPTGWPVAPVSVALVAAAVLIGATIHVGWDEFTHVGRFGATAIPPSQRAGGPLPGYRWLQYASGAVGLAVVIWVGLRQPRTATASSPRSRFAQAAPWIVLAAGVGAVVTRVTMLDDLTDLRALAFATITAAISGAVAMAVVLCGVHAVASGSLSARGRRLAGSVETDQRPDVARADQAG